MKKIQKISMKLAAVATAVILTFSGCEMMVNASSVQEEVKVVSEKVYQNNRLYTGWYSKSGAKYYAVKGKRIKGWRKIGGTRYYYFESNYKLATNKIVGSKSSGYYYVDKNGVRVTTKEIRQAVSFVTKYSSPKLSSQKRLKKCFQALLKYPYQRMTDGEPSARKIASCANYMFSSKKGNCYRYASAMAYIGRVLGYDTRVAVGAVTARGPKAPLSPHGWCEVKIGNTWKMIDCSMQRANMKKSLYLVTRKNYPYRLKCKKEYNMSIRNGKVKWS